MKILIITNHSYMLYRFRRELIEQLQKDHEVVLSMPFVGHEDDFKAMGLRCIHTEMDRRGINPKTDLKGSMSIVGVGPNRIIFSNRVGASAPARFLCIGCTKDTPRLCRG